MNINDPSTQLLFNTVKIITNSADGKVSVGTGFIYSIKEGMADNVEIPLLITAYHVLEGAQQGYFEFYLSTNNEPNLNERHRINFLEKDISGARIGNTDLAALPLGPLFNSLAQQGINIFYRSISDELVPNAVALQNLAALEEITFIGYPNGISDSKNNLPLIRQGITSSPIWMDFSGEPEFIIDAGSYPGSSGSPVFIFNQGAYPTKDGLTVGSRMFFVGMLVRTKRDGQGNFLQLGIALNATFIRDSLKAKFSEGAGK